MNVSTDNLRREPVTPRRTEMLGQLRRATMTSGESYLDVLVLLLCCVLGKSEARPQ